MRTPARTRDIQFGNFICKMGPRTNMLAMGEWLISIFAKGNERTQRHGDTRTRWFFHDPRVVELGDGIHGLAFEFVKDRRLEGGQDIDPDVDETVVGPANAPTSPSTLCLLVLNTHRLVYLPKTPYAPTMQELAATCEHLLKKVRDRHIKKEARAWPHGERAAKCSDLERELPPPSVWIVPLASTDRLDEVIARFKTIRSFTLRVFAPNPSMYKSGAELYDILDRQREAAAASTAQLVYKGPELNKELVRGATAAVLANPNVDVRIHGRDGDGHVLRQTKDAVSVRVRPEFEPGRPQEIAPEMYRALERVADLYDTAEDNRGHTAEIAAKTRDLYERSRQWFD